MGILNANPTLKKIAPIQPLQNVVNTEKRLVVDVNSVFYNLLVSKMSPQAFWRAVDRRLGPFAAMNKEFVLDGERTLAKQAEHARRDGLRQDALISLQQLVTLGQQRRKVSKAMWTKARKFMRKCATVSSVRMENIVAAGLQLGLDVRRATGEAELECAARQVTLLTQGIQSVILSSDSDIAFHANASSSFLVKKMDPEISGCFITPELVSTHFNVRPQDLPLVASFSGNDYQANIYGMGIKTVAKTVAALPIQNRSVQGFVANAQGRGYEIPDPNNFELAWQTFQGHESDPSDENVVDFNAAAAACQERLEEVRRARRPNRGKKRPKNWNSFILRTRVKTRFTRIQLSGPNLNLDPLYVVQPNQRAELADRLERTRLYIRNRRLRELDNNDDEDGEDDENQDEGKPKPTGNKATFDSSGASLRARRYRDPDAGTRKVTAATKEKKAAQAHFPLLTLDVGQLKTNLNRFCQPEVAKLLREKIQLYVRHFHRAKVIAQLCVNAWIRQNISDGTMESDLLVFITHNKPQEFWQNLLMMIINGGPRPARGRSPIPDYSVEQCELYRSGQLNLINETQKAKLAANSAFYALFADRVLEQMPIASGGPISLIASCVAKEMQQDVASLVIGKIDQLREKCEEFGIVDVHESEVEGIANFLILNQELPEAHRWKFCPISGYTESFLLFTEEILARIVNSLKSPVDGSDIGFDLIESFLSSNDIEGERLKGLKGDTWINKLLTFLARKGNSAKFLKFVIFDWDRHKYGYAQSIRKGRITVTNSFRTNGFSLYISGVNNTPDYRVEEKWEKKRPRQSRLKIAEDDTDFFSAWSTITDEIIPSLDSTFPEDGTFDDHVYATSHPLERSSEKLSENPHVNYLTRYQKRQIAVKAHDMLKFNTSFCKFLDRWYIGMDLGERLIFSAAMMNPVKDPKTIICHERSQGYLQEPLKRFQRWLNNVKPTVIAESERSMTGASSMDVLTFRNYALRRIFSDESHMLTEFYNSLFFKRQKWCLKKALRKGMDKTVEELFRMIGCSSRLKLNPDDGLLPILGIGVSSFRFHQNSFHAVFQRYLTQKVRAVGIQVIGINEYYTSQKCPHCGSFLFDVIGKDRVKYCPDCNKCYNRDNVGAENILTLTMFKANGKVRPRHLSEPIYTDDQLGIVAPGNGHESDSDSQGGSESGSQVCSVRGSRGGSVSRSRGGPGRRSRGGSASRSRGGQGRGSRGGSASRGGTGRASRGGSGRASLDPDPGGGSGLEVVYENEGGPGPATMAARKRRKSSESGSSSSDNSPSQQPTSTFRRSSRKRKKAGSGQ